MKLIFPSKKFQITLIIIGVVFALLLSIILWISADSSVCSFNPGNFCMTVLYAASFVWFCLVYPFALIGEKFFGLGMLHPVVGWIGPCITLGLVCWFLGSILWLIFNAIEKGRSKV